MKRFLLILIIVLFAGCAHNIPFQKVEGSAPIAAGEVVFLPGSYSPFEAEMIKYIASKYPSIKQLTVVPLEHYQRKLNEELEIRGPYQRVRGGEQEINFSIVPREKVAKLFEVFDRDYIFILWIPEVVKQMVTSSRGGTSVTYYVTVYGQMFARNAVENDLGRTDFMAGKAETCCFVSMFSGQTERDDVTDLIKEAADTMVDEMKARISK